MTHPQKLIYVAGSYTAAHPHEREINVHNAWAVGCRVAELGAMPVIPHASTKHMDGIQSSAFWIIGTKELMRRCDAVMLVAGWENSQGTRGEIKDAIAQGIPVFCEYFQLIAWLKGTYHPSEAYNAGLLEIANGK